MNQNKFLYTVKLIACLAIITIHVEFPEPAGLYITALARFAVPFFFAVSGRYLLVNADTAGDIRAGAARALRKLLKTTAVVFIIYQFYSVIYHLIIGANLKQLIAERFNPGTFKRFLLFNTGRVIFDDSYTFDHLWYLFAMIYVLIVIYITAPVFRKCYKIVMYPLLLALHFLVYMQAFHTVTIFGITLTTGYVLRSWLFTGVPYVFLGVLWGESIKKLEAGRTREECDKILGLWKIPGASFLTLGILSTCLEATIIGNKDIYIGSFFIVIGILLLSESLRDSGKYLWEIGKESSSRIYFYHPLVLSIMNMATDRGLFFRFPAAVKPIMLMAVSLIIFYCVPKLYRSIINVKKG